MWMEGGGTYQLTDIVEKEDILASVVQRWEDQRDHHLVQL
jgi:hypothetical protein